MRNRKNRGVCLMNKRIVLLALLFFLVCAAGPAHGGHKADAWRHAAPLELRVSGGGLDRWLAGVNGFLDRVKPQESALAELLDSDKPEDVRECEERLNRPGEAAYISRKV